MAISVDDQNDEADDAQGEKRVEEVPAGDQDAPHGRRDHRRHQPENHQESAVGGVAGVIALGGHGVIIAPVPRIATICPVSERVHQSILNLISLGIGIFALMLLGETLSGDGGSFWTLTWLLIGIFGLAVAFGFARLVRGLVSDRELDSLPVRGEA